MRLIRDGRWMVLTLLTIMTASQVHAVGDPISPVAEDQEKGSISSPTSSSSSSSVTPASPESTQEPSRRDQGFLTKLEDIFRAGTQRRHEKSKEEAVTEAQAQALAESKAQASGQTAKSSVRVFEIFESDSQRLPYGHWTRTKGESCHPKSMWPCAHSCNGCQWIYHAGADEMRVRSRYHGPFESSREYVEGLKAMNMFSGRVFAWGSPDWKGFRQKLEGIVADQLTKINPAAQVERIVKQEIFESHDSDSEERGSERVIDIFATDDNDDGDDKGSEEDEEARKRLVKRLCKLPLSMRGHVPEYIEEYWTNRKAMWSFIDNLRKRNHNGTYGDDTYNLICHVRELLGDYIDLYQSPAHFFMRRDRFNLPREREWSAMWRNENGRWGGVCLSDQHLYACRCWTIVRTKDGGSGPSYAPRERELYLKNGQPSTSYAMRRGGFNVASVIKADPGLMAPAIRLDHYRQGYHDNVASVYSPTPRRVPGLSSVDLPRETQQEALKKERKAIAASVADQDLIVSLRGTYQGYIDHYKREIEGEKARGYHNVKSIKKVEPMKGCRRGYHNNIASTLLADPGIRFPAGSRDAGYSRIFSWDGYYNHRRDLFNASTFNRLFYSWNGVYPRYYHVDPVVLNASADPGKLEASKGSGHYRRGYHDNFGPEFKSDPGRILPIGNAPTEHLSRPAISVADLNEVISRFKHAELIGMEESVSTVGATPGLSRDGNASNNH